MFVKFKNWLKGNQLYYYWDTTTKTCLIKGGLRSTCACPTVSTANSQCNTTLNLACYVASACPGAIGSGTVYTTSACNCGAYTAASTTSLAGTCDCKSTVSFTLIFNFNFLF